MNEREGESFSGGMIHTSMTFGSHHNPEYLIYSETVRMEARETGKRCNTTEFIT